MAAGISSPAWADGFRSYRVCGGTNFITCAAVEINVVGTDVTVRLWNLSGNFAATSTNTPANTVFNSIGFYNVPAGLTAVVGSESMSGPARPGDSPGNWQLQNGPKVAFIVDYAATNGNVFDDGIASGCASPGSLPSGVDLYQNPCSDPSSNPAGWVTLSFQIAGGSWDPNSSDIVIRGMDGQTGIRTECYTANSPGGRPANCFPASAVPEPVTMTL
ncbi:MAG: hypothetical protein ACREL6_04900, partial [Gemmatimonadales bacterium]